MTLKDLAVNHSYYCNESNYYSNDCTHRYDTWEQFFDEWGDADMDRDLLFRFDVKERQDIDETGTGEFYMDIFLIGQRKGIFQACIISELKEDDVPAIIEYLKAHKQHLISLWEPIP